MSIFEPPGPPDEEPPSATPTETGELADFFHTEDLPEKPERVSHRGAIEASPFMQKLLAPVTAVVVVVAVILLLIWINGASSGNKQSPAAVGAGPTQAAPVAPRTSHPPRASHSPTASPSTPGATKPHGVPAKPQATKNAKSSVPTAAAPVTVLNNSRRVGLAAAVAAELRGRRWQVAGVGNQSHVIPVTTVYYGPGEHGAAVHLAHDFGSIQRIAPNRSGGISGAGLTLVVTQSWVL